VTVPPTSGPQHAAPSDISRRTLVIIIASIGGLLVLCCAGAIHVGLFADTPKTAAARAIWPATALPAAPTAASPTPAETPSAAPASSALLTATAICQVGANGGTFYLYATGATSETFTGCAGGTPYTGTIDDLLSSTPGIDHRCDIAGDRVRLSGAVVAVYRDTTRADMRAARRFCDAYGGGGPG
jgi:hypothetical protein